MRGGAERGGAEKGLSERRGPVYQELYGGRSADEKFQDVLYYSKENLHLLLQSCDQIPSILW